MNAGQFAQVGPVREVFDRAPVMIGKKVKFSRLAPERTTRDARKALALLAEAGVLLECMHTHANGVPLLAEAVPETRKLFHLDDHLARLAHSLEIVGLDPGMTCDQLAALERSTGRKVRPLTTRPAANSRLG